MTDLTTTILSGGGTTSTVLNAISDEGKLEPEKLNSAIISSSVATGSTLAATYSNNKGVEEIYEKYSSAYVESMTEEELVRALEAVELLEKEKFLENNSKTL